MHFDASSLLLVLVSERALAKKEFEKKHEQQRVARDARGSSTLLTLAARLAVLYCCRQRVELEPAIVIHVDTP